MKLVKLPQSPRCQVCEIPLKPIEFRYCAQCRDWLEIGAALRTASTAVKRLPPWRRNPPLSGQLSERQAV